MLFGLFVLLKISFLHGLNLFMKVFSIFEDFGISIDLAKILEQGYRMVFHYCGRTVGVKGWPHPLLPTPGH